MTKFTPCSIAGCTRNAERSSHGSRGWCSAHYSRWKRYGDPTGGSTFEGAPLRFVLEVALTHKGDECLSWPFGKHGKGYGLVKVDGRTRQAHRVVCRLAHGEPPTPEHEAAHSCGNSSCVSSGHLRWATPIENAADRLIHGTHNRGERHALAKLSADDVARILLLKGRLRQVDVARQFGITQTQVSKIQTGRQWSHSPLVREKHSTHT